MDFISTKAVNISTWEKIVHSIRRRLPTGMEKISLLNISSYRRAVLGVSGHEHFGGRRQQAIVCLRGFKNTYYPISHVISACVVTWSVHESHVISARSVTWSVLHQPRDQCLQTHVIRACRAAWFLPAHLHDNCKLSCMIPAGSSAWQLPGELRDSCRLICLTIASWAALFLPGHLLDYC